MTWVYFALIDDVHVKIGKADNLAKRMSEFGKETLQVHDVRLLAAVDARPADERHTQRFFDASAVGELRPNNGNPPEVFYPSPELTNYVRWLRNQWFAVTAIDGDAEGIVSYETWEPTAERQTPPAHHPLFEPDWLEFLDPIITGDDYYTHPTILECARRVLGGIDLDPASHPMANKNVKATRFYTIHDEGLEQVWGGRVWLNPPFSEWKKWVPKIIKEYNSGRVQAMCVFSAMRTTTAQYFRPLLDEAEALCIITGRMKSGGKGTDAPDDGHCVLYFGPAANSFCEVFASVGSIWRKSK